MARMGDGTERAALVYQHETHGADRAITDAIDTHVQAARDDTERGNEEDDGSAAALAPVS